MYPRPLIFSLAVWLSLLLVLSQCGMLPRVASPAPGPAAPTLPAATQAGLNTLGFRVDGQVWSPVGSFNFPAYRAYYQNHTFWFHASQLVDNKLSTFGIFVQPLAARAGNYDLAERFGVRCAYPETNPADELLVQQAGAGTLHLTRLDSVRRIMAGTFDGELTSLINGRTVRITDGRFDLAY